MSQLQKCTKSGMFKSQAFVASDMEDDNNTHLKPPTDDDDKETKGGKHPSVVIYGYPPSQNIGSPLVNNPKSSCKQCFKVGQENVSAGRVGPATTAGSKRSSVWSTSMTNRSVR